MILLTVGAFTALRGEQPSYTDSVAALPGPEIIFPDGVTLDLGNIRPDKYYEGNIRVANGGSAPLVIKRVFSDCGCTVADYPGQSIAPGDTVSIKLTYNSAGRGLGQFLRTLRIESNTAGRRNVIFVKGVVKR